jgi:SdrD B-like domain
MKFDAGVEQRRSQNMAGGLLRKGAAVLATAALVLTSWPTTANAAPAVLKVSKTGAVVGNNYKGAVIQWTIQYSCISVTAGCDATTVVDTIPAGMTVSDASGGTAGGGNVTWNVGNMASGDSTAVTLTTIAACSTAARSFKNTATASSPTATTGSGNATVSVPAADCAVPPPPPFSKVGPNPINKGGRLNYTITLPAKTNSYKVEDVLPVGMEYIDASTGSIFGTELFCAGVWVAGSQACTTPTKVRWTVPAANDPSWLSGSNGDVNYGFAYLKMRVPTTFTGTEITNVATAIEPGGPGTPNISAGAGAPGNVAVAGPMASVGKWVAKSLNAKAPAGLTPAGKTTALDDIVYGMRFGNDGNYGNAGADWQAPVIVDLLPAETEYTANSWWNITSAPAGCTNPTFTQTPNFGGTGRTQLKWEFGATCNLSHDQAYNDVIGMNVSTHMRPGIAADTIIGNDMTAAPGAGLPFVSCDSGLVAGTCTSTAAFAMPKLATLESSKWVNGAADAPGTWGRYPSIGETSVDSQGFATYRLFLRATGNVDSSTIEIADVLPFVGDTAVSEGSLTRDSAWREMLAAPVLVEFLDQSAITAGTAVNALTGFAPLAEGADYTASYSPSTNACVMDGNGQVKFDSGSALPAGCANNWGPVATNAGAFKLKITRPVKRYAVGPDSGDVIRITVKVKDFGPAPADLDKVAWNSFAYTTTGAGIEFLTAEPIKVGVKMTAKPSPYAALGNYVWYDENNNGTQDGFEEGIDNVTVNLYDAAGVIVQSTLTTVDPTDPTKHGWYRFDGLTPTTPYTVKLDNAADVAAGGPLNGFVLSPQDVAAATDAVDSDAALVAGIPTIAAAPTAAAGSYTPTYDFGFWKQPQYSLGNRVWADDDNSGSITGSEAGIDNVLINVFKKNIDGTFSKVTSDTTKSGGYYRFDGLPAGDFYVQLDPTNWAAGGALEGRRSTTGPAKEGNPNTDLESDDNGLKPATLADYAAAGDKKGIVSNVVTLGPGKSEPANETDVPQGQGAEEKRANMTVDFGVVTPKFAVGNYVWIDTNRDGKQDATEVGVNGVTVNVLRKDGSVAGTATTVNGPDGKPGFYLVDDLLAGEYTAEFTNFPADYKPTLLLAGSDRAADSDADPVTGKTASFVLDETLPAVNAALDGASLKAANVLRTIDAGIYPTFSLGDKVWHDENGNSIADVSEPGLDGVKVDLYASNAAGQPVGAPIASQTTTSGGYYLFTGLVTGEYVVVIPSSNFATGGALNTFYSSGTTTTGEATAAPVSNGINDDDNGTMVTSSASPFKGSVVSTKVVLGPNADAPTGEPVTPGHADLTSDGRSNTTVDFGFLTMSLGNLVWTDTNNNGSLDSTETGIANVPAHLFRDDNGDGIADGSAIANTTTDGNGQYLFTGLLPGKYIVEIEPPAGYYSSSGTPTSLTGPFEPGKADNAGVDSNDHGTTVGNRIRSTTITLAPATEPLASVETSNNAIANPALDSNSDLTVDFGIVPGASIGNYVWLDNNRNGLQDEGADVGIDGATVTLFNSTGTFIKSTVTGPGPDGKAGFYRFDTIPGDYKVQFDLTTLPEGFIVSPAKAGTDDTKNSDADKTTGFTAVTNLSAGENDPTWDLGIYSTAVTVGDFVWVDTNGNGIQDDGATSGIAGVKATLYDSNGKLVTKDVQGNPIVPEITDAAGKYLFSNLKPGAYTVKFELPAGYAPTRSSAGTNDKIDSNGLTATSANLKGGQSDLTLDLGIVKPVSVGNVVWIDLNDDGIQNDSPEQVPSVVATLFDATTGKPVTVDAFGKPVAPITVGSNGQYLFKDLLPGKYTVKFSGVPSNYRLAKTNAGDPASDSDGLTATSVQLASGESDLTLDLGLVFIPVLVAVTPTPEPTTTVATTVPAAGPVATPASAAPTTNVPSVTVLSPTPDSDHKCVTGVVYADSDRSKEQGGNELGQPGVIVRVIDKNGKVVATTTTDADGRFCLDVADGTYTVEIVPPAGVKTTTPKRITVTVNGAVVTSGPVSFGLAMIGDALAFTGSQNGQLIQISAGLVLAGLFLTRKSKRERNANA